MIRWYQKRSHTISAWLAAMFAGLWLIGACAPVFACPLPCEQEASVVAPCERASVTCEAPSLDAPLPVTLEFTIFPTVLATLPAVVSIERSPGPPPLAWQSVRAPPTPLYLTHLALLN